MAYQPERPFNLATPSPVLPPYRLNPNTQLVRLGTLLTMYW